VNSPWVARSPRLSLFFRRRADIAPLNALEECPSQLALTRVALAVDRAKVKEFVAERVPFLMLGKNVLQSDRQLAQSRCFRPCGFSRFVIDRFREQSSSAAGAFIEAGKQLLGKSAVQRFESFGGHLVTRIHNELLAPLS
jgi:hypothetical protein